MSTNMSVLGDTLQRHAYENVWCSPTQDKPAILRLARLTPNNGARASVRVQWRNYVLPNKTSRFHIYQIGQVYPPLLGLLATPNTWINVAESCRLNNCLADFYSDKGIQLPRFLAWYRVTPEKNLIVAVEIPDTQRIPFDLDNEHLSLRLYSNAYYESIRADSDLDTIDVFGVTVKTTQDILDFQYRVQNRRGSGHGHTYCFVNGFKVQDVTLLNTALGDHIEYVYDGSVKAVLHWPVKDLQQFHSTLDNARKYLLHHSLDVHTIDYHDDVDLFLVKTQGTNHSGVYYHKNSPEALRMVTHRDYSVPTQYLMSYAQMVSQLGGNVDELTLVMLIRHSGYERPLVYEHNRIQDLYKLSDEEIVRAMVGVNSVVDVWTASSLEASGYCSLMRAPLGGISRQNVQEAYGYNAVSKILGDTPMRVTMASGARLAPVPVGLQNNCTAYEYDRDGLLLGWYTHLGGPNYVPQNSTTDLIEFIYGQASEGVQAWWNVRTHAIDPSHNHRFYRCSLVAGGALGDWMDVTDSEDYIITGNTVQWTTDASSVYTLVRSNKQHIAYSQQFIAVDGLLTFSLRELRSDLSAYRTMGLPLGELDVFLNGRSLLENLDYFVDFPRVVITNKEYLVGNPDVDAQNVTVRFTSFCDRNLKRFSAPDIGFVQYGVLSYNNRYDIHEDKVNRIVVDGALYRYDEFQYAEEDFDVRVIDARNGAPYAIRDILVPMNTYLFGSTTKIDPTFALRDKSRIVDKAISDYLTTRIPQKKPSSPSAIPAMYTVASPFFCKIVHDLQSGALWNEQFTDSYDDNWVRRMCQPYEWLLAFDPISEERSVDPQFVAVHPHNHKTYVEVGVYQMKFLYRVAKIYAKDRIDLSAMIKVSIF